MCIRLKHCFNVQHLYKFLCIFSTLYWYISDKYTRVFVCSRLIYLTVSAVGLVILQLQIYHTSNCVLCTLQLAEYNCKQTTIFTDPLCCYLTPCRCP